ncbi:Hypothetical predicted protein [Pelobates cultripes]|uniref:Uncharacterized protein n=1 Tax=Pelobates cultripes TaxID=61616 RepID=A0AAD1VJA7_PELCU|nr:Hypothetical predicted protein [Pelobates cultripes]
MSCHPQSDRQRRNLALRDCWNRGEAGSSSFCPLGEKTTLPPPGPSPAVSGADGRCPTVLHHRTKPEVQTSTDPAPFPPLWTGGGVPGPHTVRDTAIEVGEPNRRIQNGGRHVHRQQGKDLLPPRAHSYLSPPWCRLLPTEAAR